MANIKQLSSAVAFIFHPEHSHSKLTNSLQFHDTAFLVFGPSFPYISGGKRKRADEQG
jgi:hypothetical protein